jgi:NAD(P)H-hydrate epimerase
MNRETQAFVLETLRLVDCPAVVDADALNALAGDPTGWKSLPDRTVRVLTPHPGEFARLQQAIGHPELASAEDHARLNAAAWLAAETVTTVALKGYRTVVTDGTRALVNTTGNPGMATGGMGDVLTGIVAALLARGMAGFEAGCLAAFAHGASADELAKDIGRFGFLAREVADRLPQVWRRIGNPSMGFR